MSADNQSHALRGDRFIPICALALPLANVGLYWTIDSTGGAHGHGVPIAATVVAAESVFITWFCAVKTTRRTGTWSLAGVLLDVAVSAVTIMLITLVILAVGYAGGRAGD